jgi:hypothetical protein
LDDKNNFHVFVYALELITLTFSTIGYGTGAISCNPVEKAVNILIIIIGLIFFAKIRDSIKSYKSKITTKTEVEKIKKNAVSFYLDLK